MAWAALRRRAWFAHGAPIPSPKPGALRDEMELRVQPMPSPELWSTTTALAGAVFGVHASAYVTPAEVARRRPDNLTERQRELLARWGYPYVMEEFRFHLTLSDDLPPDEARALGAVAAEFFAPVLPQPFAVEDLCIFAEDGAGLFNLIGRHPLTGG